MRFTSTHQAEALTLFEVSGYHWIWHLTLWEHHDKSHAVAFSLLVSHLFSLLSIIYFPIFLSSFLYCVRESDRDEKQKGKASCYRDIVFLCESNRWLGTLTTTPHSPPWHCFTFLNLSYMFSLMETGDLEKWLSLKHLNSESRTFIHLVKLVPTQQAVLKLTISRFFASSHIHLVHQPTNIHFYWNC